MKENLRNKINAENGWKIVASVLILTGVGNLIGGHLEGALAGLAFGGGSLIRSRLAASERRYADAERDLNNEIRRSGDIFVQKQKTH